LRLRFDAGFGRSRAETETKTVRATQQRVTIIITIIRPRKAITIVETINDTIKRALTRLPCRQHHNHHLTYCMNDMNEMKKIRHE